MRCWHGGRACADAVDGRRDESGIISARAELVRQCGRSHRDRLVHLPDLPFHFGEVRKAAGATASALVPDFADRTRSPDDGTERELCRDALDLLDFPGEHLRARRTLLGARRSDLFLRYPHPVDDVSQPAPRFPRAEGFPRHADLRGRSSHRRRTADRCRLRAVHLHGDGHCPDLLLYRSPVASDQHGRPDGREQPAAGRGAAAVKTRARRQGTVLDLHERCRPVQAYQRYVRAYYRGPRAADDRADVSGAAA